MYCQLNYTRTSYKLGSKRSLLSSILQRESEINYKPPLRSTLCCRPSGALCSGSPQQTIFIWAQVVRRMPILMQPSFFIRDWDQHWDLPPQWLGCISSRRLNPNQGSESAVILLLDHQGLLTNYCDLLNNYNNNNGIEFRHTDVHWVHFLIHVLY